MKMLTALAILLSLAACGVDGAPKPPAGAAAPAAAPATDVTITGDVRVGVSGNL
jgi:predicted small lipoprotein YifL